MWKLQNKKEFLPAGMADSMVKGTFMENFSDNDFKAMLEAIDLDKNPPEQEPMRQYYFIKVAKLHLEHMIREAGRPLTASIRTFGCQMNARDSEKLTGILELVGYQITDSEKADFVIYNTCTVRENANNKVYGHLGFLQGYKKKNPHMKIALCGCMMQEETVVNKIQTSYRFVDMIFGTHNIYKFAELLVASLENGGMVVDVWKEAGPVVENLPNQRKFRFKTGVNIMFGCNNFCSYCIVPYVRGRERSRDPEEIIQEIRAFVADGVVEVMLLGQNVNSYGKNLDKEISFAELLRRIHEIEGLERIRFMTSHPKDLSEELIRTMKECPKICRHLHLPLQSGSTSILNKMNRKYSKDDYLGIVKKIREEMPDISLTTDIIVGFPGETEQDFEETMDVVEQVRYDSAFTFIYSKRTGTPAATMENHVPEDVIKKRFERLLKTVQEIAAEKAEAYTGTVQKILIEEQNHQDETLVTGRLGNNSLVHIKGDVSMIGKILEVRLTECRGFYYLGDLAV